MPGITKFKALAKDEQMDAFLKDIGATLVETGTSGKVKRFVFAGESGREYSISSSYDTLEIGSPPEAVEPSAEETPESESE